MLKKISSLLLLDDNFENLSRAVYSNSYYSISTQ